MGGNANVKRGQAHKQSRNVKPKVEPAEPAKAVNERTARNSKSPAVDVAVKSENGDPNAARAPFGEVKLPLEVGTQVDCRFRDGSFRLAKIIERRPRLDTETGEFEYYVHYDKLNRRMDDWVLLENLDLSTLDPPVHDAAAGEGRPRHRRKMEDGADDEHHGEFDAQSLREHEEFTKVKNVEQIELGRHLMDTWYFSPLPPEYKDCKVLYFAEFDLRFFKRRDEMLQHLRKSRLQHPPGDEFYRNGNVSMFEVDGKKERTFCQNLCYLAKLFLDHKTLYYDVDLFLFYVLCECDSRGAHVVGYFSKEKCSEEGYNLACILTLPPYQRKGYGKFLISMSYELSKIEGRVGTPERPLSDLGNVSYLGYWTRQLLDVLSDHQGSISIKELSERTCIRPDDVVRTLNELQLIQVQKGVHVLYAGPAIIARHLKMAGSAGLKVDPSKIVWTPYNAEREYASFRN
ncbi:hypothetical protein WJX73_005768 [Symbiochloris irregularis]|uniref:Histone acetyltransferase n=1 Tax=Symbiochloris irregularis TaxID=706552 RepID=A0AAW1PB79_9CHLO